MTLCQLCRSEDSETMIGNVKVQTGGKCFKKLIRRGFTWDETVSFAALKKAVEGATVS